METPIPFVVGFVLVLCGLLLFQFLEPFSTLVGMILNSSGNLNSTRGLAESDPLVGGEIGRLSLIDLVKAGKVDSVKALLARSDAFDIVKETEQATGDNAMHIVAKQGHYKWVPEVGVPRLLIDCGIDVNAKNKNGQSPLELSLLRGWQKIALVLIQQGNADRSVITASVKGRITCPDCIHVARKYC